MTDPLIGRTLGGAFVVERSLGQGGMGAVYVARHVRTGKTYAVKVLRPDHGARSEEAATRFEREAAALAELSHPGIVAIQDFARTEDGIDYLVMDLLEGEDLSERMARTGKLPLDEALRIFRETAVALTVAHDAGIIHRDLKPGNVFLRSARGGPDRAMILDFGLARMAEAADTQHLTASGVAMGTPLYMAPEQAAGERVGKAADQYALATMLYEMISGEPPFTAPSAPALLVKVLTTTAPTLAELSAAPASISAAVAHAMQKSPHDRFESVAAFLAAVEGNEAVALTRPAAAGIAQTRAVAASIGAPAYAGASPGTNPTLRIERAVPLIAGTTVLLAALGVGGAFLWKATRDVTVTVSDVRTGQFDGGVAGPPQTRQITVTSANGPWQGAGALDAGAADAGGAKPDSAVAAAVGTDSGGAHTRSPRGAHPRTSPRHHASAPVDPERGAHPANTPGSGGISREALTTLESSAHAYQEQINAIDRLLAEVASLRTKSQGLAEGHEPALCAPAIARRFPTDSDVPVVVSQAQSLRRDISRACEPFSRPATPDAAMRSKLDRLSHTFDRSLEMVRDRSISTNQPAEIADQVEQALLQARAATEGVREGRRPFPCSSAAFTQLRRLRSAGNTWSGAAAGNVVQQRDNICRDLGTDPADLRRSAERLDNTLDTAELALRSAALSLNQSLRQTRALMQ